MSNIKQGIVIQAHDKFSKVLNSLSRRIDTASKSTQKAQTRFNNFTNATQGLTSSLKRMAFVGGAALAGITALSVKAGSEFEDATASFAAITGMRGEQLAGMADSALEGSKKFGISASEIMVAQAKIASAKSELMGDPAGLKSVTTASLLLAKTADISSKLAGETVIAGMNLFKREASEATDIVDQMAKSARMGIFPLERLQEAFVVGGSSAALAGEDIAQYTSAIQIAGLSMQSASKVGYQMRQVYARMSKIFPQLKEGTVDFSQTVEALAKKHKSTKGGLDLEKLFGVRNVASIKALIDNVELLKKRIKETSVVASKGSAMKQFLVIMNTLTKKTNKLVRVIEEKLIGAFNDFLGPILKKVVEKLTSFAEWAFSGSKGANALALAIGVLSLGLLALFTTMGAVFSIGTIVMWGQAVSAAIIAAGVEFNLFFGGIGIIAGVLVALLPALWGLSAWMRKGGDKSFLSVLLDDLKDFWSSIKKIFKSVKPEFDALGDSIRFLFKSLGGSSDLIVTILSLVKYILLGFVSLTVILVTEISKIIKVLALAVSGFKILMDGISDTIGELLAFPLIKLFDLDNIKSLENKLKAVKMLTEILSPTKAFKLFTQDMFERYYGIEKEDRNLGKMKAEWNRLTSNEGISSKKGNVNSELKMLTANEGITSKQGNQNTTVNISIDKDGNQTVTSSNDTKPKVNVENKSNNGGGQMDLLSWDWWLAPI